jgi:hypothetical protein
MKAQELRLITEGARAKYNAERPAQLRDDLLKRMESAAKNGSDHIDFCFSDSPEVVSLVIQLLREYGYKATRLNGPVRFEW